MTNKARLVKREDYLQQEQAREREVRQPAKSVTVATVKRWVQEKCAPPQTSARQQFAALFAAQQAG